MKLVLRIEAGNTEVLKVAFHAFRVETALGTLNF
jgi:hypothetical protein